MSNNNVFKKPNPESIPKIREYIAKVKEEIQEISQLVVLKDSPGWEKIKTILNRKIGLLDFDLDGFHVMDEKAIARTLQTRQDLKYFIQLLDGGEASLSKLNQNLENAERQLKEIEERIGK